VMVCVEVELCLRVGRELGNNGYDGWFKI
jgi:hypothetical protein